METREQLGAWRDAVTDALVVAGIYTAEHDVDPKKALHDLLAWEVQVAMDPAVSKAAAALVARGFQQALQQAYDAMFDIKGDKATRFDAQTAIRKLNNSEGELS